LGKRNHKTKEANVLPSNDTLTQTAQIIAAETNHVRQPEFALMGFCNRYLKWLYQTYGVKDNDSLAQSLTRALQVPGFEILPSPTLTYRKGRDIYTLMPDIAVRTGNLETLIFVRKGPISQSQKNDLRLALANNGPASRQVLAFYVDEQGIGLILIGPFTR